jgi:hypothetical protein
VTERRQPRRSPRSAGADHGAILCWARNQADQAQRPRAVRGAPRSSPDSDSHPRPHGWVEKIFAPYTETGTLAAGEWADHQPHLDDYIAQAQLETRGLERDPPTRNPGPKL